MFLFLKFLKSKREEKPKVLQHQKTKFNNHMLSERKGALGEHKIDLQLAQLPKDFLYINDLFLPNPKSRTGYSQIDHVIFTPYGIFVIETKNYQGTIYGGKDRKTWLVNGKFKMPSPLIQNFGHIEAIKRYIDSKFHEYFISIVSFTKRCTFKIDMELREIKSNELVVYDIEFSEFIKRKIAIIKIQHKEPFFNSIEINDIYQTLQQANVKDPKIRESHVQNIQRNKQKVETTIGKYKCLICDKPVTEKVATFCISNKKFAGNIYCFDHQKNIKIDGNIIL
ncbi:nuclease-like protein [Bacillus oleivorans]|uniref:Nuclease-like protein n=1 Tax=Bacillus oleivorans TaxID=1448271 RepID=A0A285CMF2_9BACI|nr:nuclease-related domain-containing protein [Bacillus oleivorans]SNX68585.1 nuclease-like protein [Bacillus oleivorans]